MTNDDGYLIVKYFQLQKCTYATLQDVSTSSDILS